MASSPALSSLPCCRCCSSFSSKASPFFPVRSHLNARKALSSRSNNKRSAVVGSADVGLTSLVGSADAASRIESFWRWLCDRGVVSDASPSVTPAFVREGLGLVAQRNIKQNEVVVQVPRKLWINADTVAASEIGGVCGGLKPWVSVSLFILREKAREDSFWRSYLRILPESTDSTIFWSEKELLEIHGTQLLSTTLSVKEFVQREYLEANEHVILPHNHLFPSIALEDFLWAFGILRSRAFSQLRGESLVLIPFADLINHGSSIVSEEVAWEIKGTGLFSKELVFSLRTPLSVKPGEQVLIQYDLKKSNADLALDYGFIESRSDRNAFTLTLEIPESDPFFDDKLDVAESKGLGSTAYFDIVLGHALPQVLFSYLRLVALGGTDAFLLEPIFRNSIWGHLELPVSRANEEHICRVVRDACHAALSGYHTTIEEDETLMDSGNLSARLEIAVGVRAGEKKVLLQIDRIFKQMEQELNGLEYYQERRLRELGLVGEQGEIIFWESN